MEGEGQDDADGEAGYAAEESHDAVEGREEDGDDDEDDERADAKRDLEEAAVEAGHAVHRRRRGERARIEAEEDFQCGDNGSRVEWDFGERDDGDADGDEDGDPGRIAFGEEDVAGDFVADAFAKHEDAGAGHACVDDVGEDVGDVDAAAVFVGVPHVAVDVGEYAVSAPW